MHSVIIMHDCVTAYGADHAQKDIGGRDYHRPYLFFQEEIPT